jgi:hypothetical protein
VDRLARTRIEHPGDIVERPFGWQTMQPPTLRRHAGVRAAARVKSSAQLRELVSRTWRRQCGEGAVAMTVGVSGFERSSMLTDRLTKFDTKRARSHFVDRDATRRLPGMSAARIFEVHADNRPGPAPTACRRSGCRWHPFNRTTRSVFWMTTQRIVAGLPAPRHSRGIGVEKTRLRRGVEIYPWFMFSGAVRRRV